MRALFVAILTLVAAPDGARAADGCAERADLLGARLRSIPDYAQLVPAMVRLRLPKGFTDGLAQQVGLTIDVKDGRYHFQKASAGLADLGPLGGQLDAVDRAEALTKARAAPAYLRLDRGQKVQAVLPLMCKLASRRALYLLLEDRARGAGKAYVPPKAPPRLEGVLGQLEALPGAVEKAAALTTLLQQSIGQCKALTERFAALAQVPTAERRARLAEAAPAGLKACKCDDVDIDAFEAFLIRALAPSTPPAYARRLQLGCGGEDGHLIRLAKGATSQALAEALDRENPSGPVRIVAP